MSDEKAIEDGGPAFNSSAWCDAEIGSTGLADAAAIWWTYRTLEEATLDYLQCGNRGAELSESQRAAAADGTDARAYSRPKR